MKKMDFWEACTEADNKGIEKILHEEFDGCKTYQEPYNLAYLDADYIASIPTWSKCYRDDVEMRLQRFADHENYDRCINKIMEWLRTNAGPKL